jgi:hypothetical protein
MQETIERDVTEHDVTLPEYIRSHSRYAFGLAGATILTLSVAGSASAAVQTTTDTSGVPLDSAEGDTSLSISPAPGKVVSATVQQPDCDPTDFAAKFGKDADGNPYDCRYTVTAVGDPTPTATAQATTTTAPASKIVKVKPTVALSNVTESDAPSDPSAGTFQATTADTAAGAGATSTTATTQALAAAAPSQFYSFGTLDDQICGKSAVFNITSCTVWHLKLHSKAWEANNGYAWGLCHWSHCGDLTVENGGVGWGVDVQAKGWVHDYTCLYLYGSVQAQNYLIIKGKSFSRTLWIHRHYTECGPDGVTHQRRTWVNFS